MAQRELRSLGIWAGVLLLHVVGAVTAARWWMVKPVLPDVQWVQALVVEPPPPTRVAPPPLTSRAAPVSPALKTRVQEPPTAVRPESKPEPAAVKPALDPAPVAESRAEARPAEGRQVEARGSVYSSPSAPASNPGAELTPPSHLASYLSNPPPPYPAISKRLGEQGRVVVRVYIDESGVPKEAQLAVKSGYSRLDSAALEAVMSWRYVPAKRGTVPLAMWFNVPVTFDLKSNKD